MITLFYTWNSTLVIFLNNSISFCLDCHRAQFGNDPVSLSQPPAIRDKQALSLWPDTGGREQHCPFPPFLELSRQRVQGIPYPQSANQGFDSGNPKVWKSSGPFCLYCVLDHESLVNLQFRSRNSGDGIGEQGSRVIESLQAGHCAWQWTTLESKTFMVPRQVCGQELSEDPSRAGDYLR